MRTAIALFCVALLIGCGDTGLKDTAAPPAQPRPIEATQAEMEAGTETDPRTVSPLRVAQAVAALAGEGATEVVDAAVGAAGEDDTTHAYSKDNIYDYVAQNDADYDGLPSAVEAGAIDAIGEIDATLRSGSDETLITGTAGTNTYTAVWNADGDLVDGYDPATKQDIPSEGAFADGDKTALDTIGGYVDQDVSSGSSPTLDGTNFSGIPIGGVADGALVTAEDTISGNDNDTTIPTSAAVKDYADSVVTGSISPTDASDEDATFYPIIVDGAEESQAAETDGEFTYNPSTGVLAATIFSGSGESLTWADGKLIDLSAITMSPGEDEGIALPAYADVAPDTEKNYAAYDAANNAIMVRESGGWVNASAGSGAATSLNFVTTQAEGSLSTESILSASSGGAGITVTDAGGDGGAITITLDTTEVDATTWSDNANAANVWTFDVSGTDHTMTAGDGVMTFGDAVTVTDTLTATNGIALGTSKSITGTTGLTVGGGTETIAINSSDWDIDATGVATGFGNITSDGTIVANAIDAPGDVDFDIGSEDVDDVTIITDGGTVIIDGQAIADNHLLSVDDAGAADGQVAVFTASGVEGHATVDDTELGYLNGVTAALSGFDSENEIEALIFDADDELVTADWEWQDGVAASFGDDNDWEVAYDEDGDDALEFTSDNDAADTVVSISNADGTYEANLEVEGDGTFGGIISAETLSLTAADGSRYISLGNNTSGNQPSAATVGTGVYSYETDLYIIGNSAIHSKFEADTGDIYLYGATDDSGYEYQIDVTDPTADRTITIDDNNIDFSDTTEDYVLKYNASTKTWAGEADSTGSALGSNLSSASNNISSDTGIIQLNGTGNTNDEDLDIDFETDANTVGFSSDTGVTLVDFGGIGLAGGSFDASEGNISNVGSIALDAINADATNVIFGSAAATQLQFRDSAIYIASLDDGHLDLEADTSVDVNAPLNIGGDTDIGDYDMTSVDKLEGVDSAVFVDLGADGIAQIAADTGIHFDASDETLIVSDGGADLINVTTDTGVATVDFGTINLATDALDLSDGNITNGGSIAIDAITADDTNVLFGTGAATQLQLRDTAIYIASLNDGYLDLEADTGIRFNGPVTFANEGAITLPNDTVTMAMLDDDGNFTDWTGNWTFSTGAFTLGSGAVLSDGQALTFDESAADPNDADVKLSATDGVFKIASANGANNEDITIDTDGAEDTVTFGSSTGVTAINFGSLNMATTGTIAGAIAVATDADGKTLTAPEGYGSFQLATGAGTWELPAVAIGMSVCVYSTTAAAVVVDPNANDRIIHQGTAGADGENLTSASEAGNFICLIGDSADGWITLGASGTWTAE